MAISSLGVGSGIDIQSLVASLVQAEGAGKTARLDRREIDYQAKLSILSSVKSALSDFRSSLNALSLTSSYNSFTAESTDDSIFTATASNGAEEATYSIEVTTIAQAHKLKSVEQADRTTSIGTGTLQFTEGDGSVIDVDITDGSLEGIRDAINDANFGVEASIIFNGTGYVLSMATGTGTDSALTSITATATTTGSLANFTTGVDPLINLSDIQPSANAVFTVNGVGIVSQTNTITKIIDNVSLELKANDVGNTQSLTIGRDYSAIEEAVSTFIEGYNGLTAGFNSATFYNSDTEQSGVLIGDPTVRGIISQMRNILNTTVGDATTEYNSFASIGILTARDGTLEFDATKLTAALAKKPDEIQFLLAGGRATIADEDIDIVSITDNIGSGSYLLDLSTAPERATRSGTLFAPVAADFDLSGEADLSFSVIIDGVDFGAGVLSINAQDYTGATDKDSGENIAAAIQAAINNDATLNSYNVSAIVSFTQDLVTGDYQYKIASSLYGAGSTIEYVPGGASTLGNFINTLGNPGAADVGVDGVATIGDAAATFDGNRVTGSGIYAGFLLDINNATSGLKTINVSQGNIGRLDSLIASFLESDGLIQSKTSGLSSSISDINDQREALARRLSGLESRLIKQFSSMDSLIAKLNSTSNFLTSQLDQISNIGIRK